MRQTLRLNTIVEKIMNLSTGYNRDSLTTNQIVQQQSSSSTGATASIHVTQQQHAMCHVPLSTPATATNKKSFVTKTMHVMRDYKTAVKNGRAFKPYSKTERKVRDATRNTREWGPTGAQLILLAQLSFEPNDCAVIFTVLEERFRNPPEKWRSVNKALCVLEYLVTRGSQRAVELASSEHMLSMLERLEGFSFVTADAVQRDVGATVRQRAGSVRSLLLDPEGRLMVVRRNGEIQSRRMAGWSISSDLVVEENQNIDDDGVELKQQQQEEEEEDERSTANMTGNNNNNNNNNAGETKGISVEDNERHMAALKKLLQRKENSVCADCGLKGPGARPTWASVNCGVFLCLRCAGIHRSLGTHVSQVRSCSLDMWHFSQLECVACCGGNEEANRYWEYGLEGKPLLDTVGDLERFIREKYVEKKYCDGNVEWPPSGGLSGEVLDIVVGAMNAQQLAEYQASLVECLDDDDDDKDVSELIDLMDEVVVVTESQSRGDVVDPLAGLFEEEEKQVEWDFAMAFPSAEEVLDKERDGALNDEKAPRDSTLNNNNNKEQQGESSPGSTATTENSTTYKPFWAPSLDCTSEGISEEFGSAFNTVPSQFTSASNHDHDAEVVHDTLEYLGLRKAPAQPSHAMAMASQPMQMKKDLKPHEKKAHDLVTGMLRDFDLTAGIASVSPGAIQRNATNAPKSMVPRKVTQSM
jgi:hypothetical protein